MMICGICGGGLDGSGATCEACGARQQRQVRGVVDASSRFDRPDVEPVAGRLLLVPLVIGLVGVTVVILSIVGLTLLWGAGPTREPRNDSTDAGSIGDPLRPAVPAPKSVPTAQTNTSASVVRRDGVDVTRKFLGKGEGPIISGDVVVARNEAGLVGFELADPAKPRWLVGCAGDDNGRTGLVAERIVLGGMVLFQCESELLAVEAGTGAVRWRWTLHDDDPEDVAASDHVVAIGDAKHLDVLDAVTGKSLWARDLSQDRVVLHVTVDDVFIGLHEMLEAADSMTGATRWTAPIAASSIVSEPGVMIIRTIDYEVMSIDVSNGQTVWKTEPNPPRIRQGFAIGISSDVVVVVGNSYSTLSAYDKWTGSFRWEYSAPDGRQLAARAAEGRVAIALEPELVILDASTGRQLATESREMSAQPSIGSRKIATIDITRRSINVHDLP